MENHSEVCLEKAGGIWGLMGGGDGCSSADIHVTHPGEEMEENGNEVSGGYLFLESVYLLIQQRWNQDLVVVQRQVPTKTQVWAQNHCLHGLELQLICSSHKTTSISPEGFLPDVPQEPSSPTSTTSSALFSLIIFLLQRCLRGSGRGNGEARWGH